MKSILTLSTLVLCTFFSTPAAADSAVMTFYADWCGKCQQLDPKLDALAPAFEGANMTVTRLDFTDRSEENTTAQRARAVEVGGEKTFDVHNPGTGFAIIYDTDNGNILARINADMTEAQITTLLSVYANDES